MGKSISSECVIQILSPSQKHEQVLKFPTHILSAQSGRVTTHKWFDAAWGPATQWGGGEGGIIFSSLQWPSPADWAFPFSRGRSESAGASTRALENTLFLCAMVLSQHNSRQSVWWGCCQPPTWATNVDGSFTGWIKRTSSAAFATVGIRQRFLWTWEHVRPDQKEPLVGCLSASKSTHVCFPSPQTTVIAEIILHSLSIICPALQQLTD